MASFRLEKWYLDCVSSQGNVFIGYAARLRYGPFRLNYGAGITKSGNMPDAQRQTFRLGELRVSESDLEWINPALGVRGRWARGNRIPRMELVGGPDGGIEWECLGGACGVDIVLDGAPISGTGYAERLVLTIPPWKLPFRELRWGRFISDDLEDQITWIDMRDGLDRSWIWAGSRLRPGTVGDDEIRVGTARLRFEASSPVRVGNVADRMLGRLGFLKFLIPRGARNINESKFAGKGELIRPGSASVGTIINEVVKWE